MSDSVVTSATCTPSRQHSVCNKSNAWLVLSGRLMATPYLVHSIQPVQKPADVLLDALLSPSSALPVSIKCTSSGHKGGHQRQSSPPKLTSRTSDHKGESYGSAHVAAHP